MASESEYQHGRPDGLDAAATNYYAPFTGVMAVGRDFYLARYEAAKPPWIALPEYRDRLTQSLSGTVRRRESIEKRVERERAELARDELAAAEEAAERRQAGGVRRISAGVLRALDPSVAHARKTVEQDLQQLERWTEQEDRLRTELQLVEQEIHGMGTTVRSLLQP